MASKRSKASKERKRLEKSIREANRRLQSMQAQGLGKISTVKKGLQEYAKITGVYEPTFEIPKKLSGADVKLLQRNINIFLESNWTTKQGRERIVNKTKQTFMSGRARGLSGQAISETKALRIMDLFAETSVKRAIEKGMLTSDQIVALVRDSDTSARNIANAIENAMRTNLSDLEAYEAIRNGVGAH